jgi:hypothetical protein
MGLRLGLYGKGWERHPRFAGYARGPVAYGADLEAVTRRSRINLQIVPYLCLHQRLLDGLIAGGFYLIRRHPADTEVGELLAFLDRNGACGARDEAHAHELVPADGRDELARRVEACRPSLATSPADDVVELARQWREFGLLDADATALPGFGETSFSNADEFRRQVRRFLADGAARDAVRQRQRASVVRRFSYVAGIGQVLDQIGRLVAENASAGSVRGPETSHVREAA